MKQIPTFAEIDKISISRIAMDMQNIPVPAQQFHPNDPSTDPSVTQAIANPDTIPEIPPKRKPGRPKGSTKKSLTTTEPSPPKVKRPVGRPRKDGFPAGSVGPPRARPAKQARTQATPSASAPAPASFFFLFKPFKKNLSP
jgi:hypothetical protein